MIGSMHGKLDRSVLQSGVQTSSWMCISILLHVKSMYSNYSWVKKLISVNTVLALT